MTRSSLTRLLLLTLLAGSGAGCGLFSTGVPEKPRDNPPIPPNFSVPESTLATMARAVNARSASDYGQCLADTLLEQREFHASFDPADITQFEQSGRTPPADWRRDNELTFFPQFMTYNPNAYYDLYFSLDTDRGGIIDVGGATAKKIYNLHYRVWAAGSPVAAGSAGLTFERVGLSGDVKVTFWEDHRDTADVRTWGSARLNGR
jgi:hypothetical protein